MNDSKDWNKFSLKIIGYCSCGSDERKIRRSLRKINDTRLISIDLENGSFTLSTVNHPIHLIRYLQKILHKQVIIDLHDNEVDPPPVKMASPTAGNIIDVDQIPEFLDKVSRKGNLKAVNVGIRFVLKERFESSSSKVNQNHVLHGSRRNVSKVGCASPTTLPPPLSPGIMPSAPTLPENEAYVYRRPVNAAPIDRGPPYHYYGSSTSSDDYPKDYPCAIL